MLRKVLYSVVILLLLFGGRHAIADQRPNILFCLADDWGWPHASAYGDPVVRTPTFDRLAANGVLFERAFVAAPSCTSSRNAILTGQWHWRLGEGVNQRSTLHPRHDVFPRLLEAAGYHVGHWRKAWGPGVWNALGRERHPAGDPYPSFAKFWNERPDDAPFCFWMGTSDPHRPYTWQSGAKAGIDLEKIKLPADLPDHRTVRHDVADYYREVQRFDSEVGDLLEQLERAGELENTVVVMSGDHGMPFPRHKNNLYDSGTRVPLVISWRRRVPDGRRVRDFVSLTDLAPTLLAAAGCEIPAGMTGRSLLPILMSDAEGEVDPRRDHVLTGRERHGQSQQKPNPGGYPMRAIRTARYLYIRNYRPERWPAGVPQADRAFNGRAFGDCDPGPTKEFLIAQRDDARFGRFYQLAFGQRPGEELYDLQSDPDQLVNVADRAEYAETLSALSKRLHNALRASGDPRVTDSGDVVDTYPFRRGRGRK